MDQVMSNILIVIGLAFMLLVIGAVAGSILTGRQIRDAIAAQPAPVIHNTATANAGGGGGTGVGAGTMVAVLAVLALAAWAATGFKTGAVERAVSDVPLNQRAPAAQAVPAPTAIPAATIAPMAEPQSAPVTTSAPLGQIMKADNRWLVAVIGVLVLAALGIYGYIGVQVLGRRAPKARPPAGLTPARSEPAKAAALANRAREQRLEDILPEAVHEVAR